MFLLAKHGANISLFKGNPQCVNHVINSQYFIKPEQES